LKAVFCPIYDENLVYGYYGRPAYKPYGKTLHTSLPGFRPICFVLRAEALKGVKRVVPLDTGALQAGAFKRHLTAVMTKENFEIGTSVDEAARFVGAFFETNKRYYFGQLRDGLKLSPTDLIAHAYQSIVADSGTSDVDDRRSSIEIHFTRNIRLSDKTVRAI